MTATQLSELDFVNRFTNELPADSVSDNFRRHVEGACFSRVQPTPVPAPSLVAWSPEVAADLGLDESVADDAATPEVFGGNVSLDGMAPFAACYGGHQFGNWAGQLGDGRAIALGEIATPNGPRELQLKGAGPTPYSRNGDGLAVLRSSVREFLCSEAMHHLGVPTTRALSLVTTGSDVVRDMFYDGNPAPEPGAIVCRVAPTFIRFGNFELFASRGDTETLTALADFTLRHHFAHLGEPGPDTYAAMLAEIIERTAEMIVHWQRVGFVHGVMNTDNMSILGLTIDYGPYGWLEDFDPGWTPNTTDAQHRRYRYGAQPEIAYWNLGRLANALFPIVNAAEPLQEALDTYVPTYQRLWRSMMSDKLGLPALAETEADTEFLQELFGVLQLAETDMTIFFRRLGEFSVDQAGTDAELVDHFGDAYYLAEQRTPQVDAPVAGWLRAYQARVRASGATDGSRREAMHAVNPKYVLRNYLAQLAIDAAAAGDSSGVVELLDVLRRPYDEQPEREAEFAQRRPEWARHRPGCSMLSCSS